MKRQASIKETGEELSPAEWERFDAAVAEAKAERERSGHADEATRDPHEDQYREPKPRA